VDPVLHAVTVAALVALLLHAALGKLRAPLHFAGVLADYRLLPAAWVTPASWLLPIGELAVAAGLALPATRSAAALACAALLLAYAAAIGINLARGRRTIDCGCGGPDARRPIQPAMLARNAALAALAASLLAPLAPRELVWLDWLHATMLLAAAVGLYATLGQWTQNRRVLRAVER